ncbi:MAG TPA: AsnC family transcriptional regulator [Rhodospirillaceae bacterium]|nr:AsnC family transcriptional regulator [Rhodospirillaceae bacterium]MBL25391.1 AsnC family transcriptional regulator [Rhodospirillaceae bacterium]HAA92660.1 AsnC family transcriptional regulator [Rhodospirillaceae bacterium]HAT34725.1 AsnC family transcriptional regulator [Rhodospirillaceae bacterium]|tara:strand:+ start:307 stop:753 length:447 start_codon:yes stop_codon:yes gene_type:complete
MDQKTLNLLRYLAEDARLSFNALARRVGLSPPAVAERVRRLEESGALLGYHAKLDRRAIGLPITAFLRLRCPGAKFQAVRRLALELPQVLECHHITGEACFLVKLAAPTVESLEALIERFREHGEAESSVVLSSVVEQKPAIGAIESE